MTNLGYFLKRESSLKIITVIILTKKKLVCFSPCLKVAPDNFKLASMNTAWSKKFHFFNVDGNEEVEYIYANIYRYFKKSYSKCETSFRGKTSKTRGLEVILFL